MPKKNQACIPQLAIFQFANQGPHANNATSEICQRKKF